MEDISYYKKNLPTFIGKLKKSLDQLYPIIEQEIDSEIKDDKLFSVLKGKRQAAEDVEWTLKKIDELENELYDRTPDESNTVSKNSVEKYAEK